MNFKWFYTTAILSMWTLGASWGIFILLQLGTQQEFTKLNLFEINAHGQAQIFGWIGMMLIGTVYWVWPRLFKTSIPYPFLNPAVWLCLITGIILSISGLLITPSYLITLIGGTLNGIAVVLFGLQMIKFFHEARENSPAKRYAVSALFFLLISTAYSAWHHLKIIDFIQTPHLFKQVATFQAPLRDLQIHGVGLCMVLATMQWLFWQPSFKTATRAWLWIMMAVIGEVGLFFLYRFTGHHLFAALLILPWSFLCLGTYILFIKGKLFVHLPPFAKRTTLWLFVSEGMLLFLPLYSSLSHLAFSHAYYGAIRHAITVGFLSQMILGMAPLFLQKFFYLQGPSYTLAYLLLNLGCFCRVSFQIASDFSTWGFSLISISGILELSACLIWGISLLRLLKKRSINPFEIVGT